MFWLKPIFRFFLGPVPGSEALTPYEEPMTPSPYTLTVEVKTAQGLSVFHETLNITQEDLQLGLPGRIMGQAVQAIGRAREAVASRERKSRSGESVDIQE